MKLSIKNCRNLLLIIIAVLIYCDDYRIEKKENMKWPYEVKNIKIKSTSDGTQQDAMFYVPFGGRKGSKKPVPLVVALHTWSGDFTQIDGIKYYEICKERGWILIHPNFRGPNNNPDAGGSEKAVQDVLDAVNYAFKNSNVDRNNVFLIGGSGGGYMSLLMAGKTPNIWSAISVWVPISDLVAWHNECKEKGLKYANDIEAICGGPPGISDEIDNNYKIRSPINFIANAVNIPIDINAGIHDGHSGSVPISHSLNVFNVLTEANKFNEKVISRELIERFVNNEAVPEELKTETDEDSTYSRKILFRRTAGPVRVTIFEGGHEILYDMSFKWFDKQNK